MTFPYHTFTIVNSVRGNYPVATVIDPPINEEQAAIQEAEKNDHPEAIYIADLMPGPRIANEALGSFMIDWGNLETALHALFKLLLGVDEPRSRAVLHGRSGRALRDLILNLAKVTLDAEAQSALLALTDRFDRINSKRNTIVHGIWTVEIVLYGKSGRVIGQASIIRQLEPVSDTEFDALHNPKNQALRAKHLYTIKRIHAVMRDARALTADVQKFTVALGAL